MRSHVDSRGEGEVVRGEVVRGEVVRVKLTDVLQKNCFSETVSAAAVDAPPLSIKLFMYQSKSS